MKSVKSFYKIPLYTALITVVIAVPMRIYQYFKVIEPGTGFYDKIDFSVYLMYILLVACIVTSIISPLFAHNKSNHIYNTSGIPLMIVSFIAALGIVVDSASQLIEYFGLYDITNVGTGQTLQEYVSTQGGSLLLGQAITGFLCVVYFFIIGLTAATGKFNFTKFRLLSLIPVLWCVFRLLYRFKRTISFVNVSDLMIELFMIVFMMLFFFAYAQVTTRIEADSAYKKLFMYGIPAAVCALVCFIPRFILMITGNSDLLSEHYGVNYGDFAVAVFIIYNLISRVTAKQKSKTANN